MSADDQIINNRVANPRWTEAIISKQFEQQSRNNTRSPLTLAVAPRIEPIVNEESGRRADAISRLYAVRRVILNANSGNSPVDFTAHIIGNELEAQFRFFANRWYRAIKFVSSTTRMTTDPNYFRIIGMGSKVVPLILHELEHKPAPWFAALRLLTGNSEVGREHVGNFEKIAESWIAWGKQNAII